MVVRYWAFLLAKLAVAGLLVRMVWSGLRWCFPHPTIFLDSEQNPFPHDLGYTTAVMLFFLFCVGMFYTIVWDQRYRCRTCLRRLRMPMTAGSWPNMLLFGQPRTEYICVYGHGTLKVPEVQISGTSPDWEPHDDDIWKELEALEESKK